MDWNAFFELFWHNINTSSVWEIVAVVFGILSVWYAQKAKILVYPTGIISTAIYIFVCYFAQLYADMGVNVFYTSMSIYGWYMWTRKDENKNVLPIRWNTKKEQVLGILMIPVLYVIILGLIWIFMKDDPNGFMKTYVPYVDSLTTSIFLIGMWYMARKKIENWIYWIVGDIISIPLYFAKGLVFTSFQFIIFLILAIMGLIQWKKYYFNMRNIL